jgi:hypothetical protein
MHEKRKPSSRQLTEDDTRNSLSTGTASHKGSSPPTFEAITRTGEVFLP